MSIHDLRSTDVPAVARALMMGELAGGGTSAVMAARSAGASERVTGFVQKAAVGGLATLDGAGGQTLADWRISANAWFGTLRTASVFFRLWDSGLRRVPLRTYLGISAMEATGWIVGEGAPIPLTTIDLDAPSLEPVTAAAMLVITDELVRASTADAQNLINAELRAAVSRVVDERFWQLVMPSPTYTASASGNDEAAAKADLRGLLEAVNTTGAGYLVFAMAPDVANALCLFDRLGKNMTPQGGELLGLPAMVSDAVPAGTLRLVNGAAVAGGLGDFDLGASRNAVVEMNDAPEGGASAVMTSLWQTNRVVLRALVNFAARRTRDDATGQITGITWGEEEEEA